MSGLQYYATAYNWCSPRYLDYMIHKDISALAFAMKKENLYSGQFFYLYPAVAELLHLFLFRGSVLISV